MMPNQSSTKEETQKLLQELPSVDRLLNTAVAVDMVLAYGRNLTVESLRDSLAAARQSILKGEATYAPMNGVLMPRSKTRWRCKRR